MPVTACTTFAFEVDRKTVITIEGLAEGGGLDQSSAHFWNRRVSMRLLHARHDPVGEGAAGAASEPDEALIRQWLSANICRCTGYQMIVEAVRAAARSGPG
jgi:carbon-monoxide dehydrogenase small subunit